MCELLFLTAPNGRRRSVRRERGGDEARDRGAHRDMRREQRVPAFGALTSGPTSASVEEAGRRPLSVDASNVKELSGTGKSGRVLFDAGWFLVWLRARLAGIRPPGTYVPHAIAEFARDSGHATRLEATRLLDRQLCEGFLPSPCEKQLVLSFGVYLSVMCRDVIPFTDRSR